MSIQLNPKKGMLKKTYRDEPLKGKIGRPSEEEMKDRLRKQQAEVAEDKAISKALREKKQREIQEKKDAARKVKVSRLTAEKKRLEDKLAKQNEVTKLKHEIKLLKGKTSPLHKKVGERIRLRKKEVALSNVKLLQFVEEGVDINGF